MSGRALAVKRFDRSDDGGAVHVEDFAQVFGVYLEDKYEKANARNIAAVVGAESSEEDVAEFIRRLTFNVLIGNADMHLKNWSLIYPDKHNTALAPAYDFLSTTSYIRNGEAALKFSRTKRFDGYSEDELSHLAAKASSCRRSLFWIRRVKPSRCLISTGMRKNGTFRCRVTLLKPSRVISRLFR